ILGPTNGGAALLDRGSAATAQYALELIAAKDVTIRNLSLTGGERGLSAVDADRLVVDDSKAFNNASIGFFVESDTSDARLSGNEAFGTTGNSTTDQDTGFFLRGTRLTVEGNTSYRVGPSSAKASTWTRRT